MEENNILYNKQFGFSKGNLTINALIQITEKIKESIDKEKVGYGIFIDLRKAFDTVNHDILLVKLVHYGIRDSALLWFESYLSKRKQFVCINGERLRELSMVYLTYLTDWISSCLLMIQIYTMKMSLL